ncbi:MAG: ABC transporter permease [Saprospiraceae bacterium]|nr:ABC transporter permease [Bacteroidia bacterium]NNE15672.1 ABC transporter permease [Saprospiraceae bacterium]
MNKNLYFKELKRNRKSLIVWSAVVIAFTFIVMSVFPYMRDMGDDMAVMMSKLPEGMLKAMGIDAETFKGILGMYNTYYGIYIIVLLSIFASSTGATIISKEEKDKTAEFLLTKPISRKNIYITKMLVLITLALTAFLIQTITAIIFIIGFGEENVNWSVFVTMHLHGLVLILFFTCIGVFLSMLIKPKKNFMGITVGIVFGSYFLNAIAQVGGNLSWLGYLSPFHYLDFSVTDPNYSVNVPQVFIFLFLSAALLILSFRLYKSKDISA